LGYASRENLPFAAQAAIYRRPIAERGALQPVGGLPKWLSGVCDTDCIDVNDSAVALADGAGNVYLSEDVGRTWSCCATGRAGPSAITIV